MRNSLARCHDRASAANQRALHDPSTSESGIADARYTFYAGQGAFHSAMAAMIIVIFPRMMPERPGAR